MIFFVNLFVLRVLVKLTPGQSKKQLRKIHQDEGKGRGVIIKRKREREKNKKQKIGNNLKD